LSNPKTCGCSPHKLVESQSFYEFGNFVGSHLMNESKLKQMKHIKVITCNFLRKN